MTALPFRTFDDCGREPSKAWAIKGVVALDEDSSWFGPPGSLKSSLLADLSVHLAAGREWRGRKVPRSLGVVFFAFERAALTRRRLAAYKIRDALGALPIAVCDRIVDMVDLGCVTTIVDTINEAEKQFGVPIGLVVVDTYSKGVAAGGGDEDKAQHVNCVAANMKLVHEQLMSPVHIATIGHTGKDETRGERGSSAKLGHVDLAVQISGDVVRIATIVKANDLAEGALTSFRMEDIAIGADEDGEPRTVGILSTEAVAITPKARATTTRQSLALNALDRALRDHGQEPPAGTDIPPYLKVVAVEQWRLELFRCGVLDRDAKNPRSAFKKIKDGLVDAQSVVERDGFIWPAQPGGGNVILPHFPGSPSIIPPPPPYPSPVPCPPS
jgi:hypothetical protein